MKRIILIIVIMLIGCTTKQDVIRVGKDTYVFTKRVEHFYLVDPVTGEKVEVTE